MDGILVPICGVLISGLFGIICIAVSRFRRFLLAALASPFITSVVFLFGGFVLGDMNPAREHGASYIPTGKEHDPTRLDYGFWVLAVVVTFAASSALANGAQQWGVTLLQKSYRTVRSENGFRSETGLG